MNSTAGERIRKMRRAHGLSQKDLAQAAGVTVRTLQNIESGRRHPERKLMRRLSIIFHMKIGEVLGNG